MMLGAALSNQFGAATGALAFGVIGPGLRGRRAPVDRRPGAAGRRASPVAVLHLGAAASRAAAGGGLRHHRPVAVQRDRPGLCLGLAVTLEFLGPLAVALATSRRRTDLACALVAGAGVIALTCPRLAIDYAGIGLALLAAVCWASYILLNRQIGRRLPGAQGPAAAAGGVGAGLPADRHRGADQASADGGGAGVRRRGRCLSSAIPFLLDLLALRRIPAYYFGIFMSVHPVLAALVGLVVLGQPVPWLVLAEHRRHRRRQRGQLHGSQRRGSPAR